MDKWMEIGLFTLCLGQPRPKASLVPRPPREQIVLLVGGPGNEASPKPSSQWPKQPLP